MRGRVGIAALLGALLTSSCTLPGQVEGPVELTAVFDDVGDLVAGHSVQVADVRVGSIVGIELTEDFRALVTMRIKDDLELPVGTEAILRTTSLLGEKFIELRPQRDLAGQPVRQGPFLENGQVVADTSQAPELEFVAQEAVEVLGGVISSDLSTLIETGSVAFAGRSAELGSVLESLAVVSGTLADQTGDIVSIIDNLDRASATLASGSERIDALLVNLARTTEVLADNRELTLQTLRDLTRLARAQNEIVFEPFRDDIERQIRQLDSVLSVVAAQRGEVEVLVDWLAQFSLKTPLGVPGEFAQVYGWFELLLIGEAP